MYVDGAADQACHAGEVPAEWREAATSAIHLHHTPGPGAGPPALQQVCGEKGRVT